MVQLWHPQDAAGQANDLKSHVIVVISTSWLLHRIFSDGVNPDHEPLTISLSYP